MWVVYCTDPASPAFGCLAGAKGEKSGWVRPDPDRGGWFIFASKHKAVFWAAEVLGWVKTWDVCRLQAGVAVAGRIP